MSDSETVKDTLETARETGQVVEQFLREYCFSALQGQEELARACEGSLTDIGLRIRPFFLRISCQEGGIVFDKIVPVAAGVEMIQLSTLIIDDILDESPLRNNKPSIFAREGAKVCLSIGTIMSLLGLRLIADGLKKNQNLKNNIAVVQLFSQTHADIYIGQYLDLRFEGDISVGEDQYLDMISRTTACFIQAPLVAGAMLWDACPEIIKTLEKAGLSLGMAYQIRDDVIDMIGDSECTGKPIGGDVRRRKMRLPLIQALWELSGRRRRKLAESLRATSLSDEAFSEALELINESGSIDYCISKTKEYCEQAANTIDMLSEDFASLKAHLCVVANWISSFEDRT
jgi:geranylgeranyl pyrophosphate synthase